MWRPLLLLMAGAASGAGALHLATRGDAPALSNLETLPRRGAAATAAPAAAGDRFAFYALTRGADAADLERWARASSPSSAGAPDLLTLDASLMRLAELDPARALRLVEELDDPALRAWALGRSVAVLAFGDARAALAAVEGIARDHLRARAQTELLTQWAVVDPDALFAYVERLDARTEQRVLGGALGALSQMAPLVALELLDRLRPRVESPYADFVVQRAAEQNAARTLAYVEQLPSGAEQQRLLQAVAVGYGRQDPDAALAWVRNQAQRPPGLLPNVLGGLARVDLQRALELASTEAAPSERGDALTQIALQAANAGTQPQLIAQRLAELPPMFSAQAAQMHLMRWAQTDADGALEWLLEAPERSERVDLAMVAQWINQLDPERAAAQVDRIPAQHRARWIAEVARGYGRTDAERGLRWLDQFRGEAAHAPAAAALAREWAQRDAPAVAQLLDQLELSSMDAMAVDATVAWGWAMTDPPAAAAWALGRQQTVALQNVVNRWARSDADAATLWVYGLPAGAQRDAALSSLLPAVATERSPDPHLLASFRSDQARQQAIVGAVSSFAWRDLAEGRQLVERYVTDPQLRQQAQQMLELVARPDYRLPRGGFSPGVASGPSPTAVIEASR